MALDIPDISVQRMLESLLGRDVEVEGTGAIDLHVESVRGLVTNENELVGAVGGDLNFVANAGASLALMPPVNVEELDEETEEAVVEFYGEVANVMSRLVNDHGDERVRIDPNMTHPIEDLGLVIGAGGGQIYSTTISGYGSGTVGLWSCL